MPAISVILPAWNEAARLAATLATVGEFLGRHSAGGEIVVVDDGSTDGSPEIARRHGARVIVHPENRGKGAAVRTGMVAATSAFRLYCDVDLSTPMDEALHLHEALISGAAVAVGSRRGQPLLRRRRRTLLSATFSMLTRSLVPGVADTQCGFKMFTAAAVDRVFPRMRIERYAFDVELLVIARRQGLRVDEVPIRWSEAGSSRVRVLRDGTRMLADLSRIAARDARGGYV